MKRPTTHLVALHIVLVPCLTTYLILQISEAYNKEETEEQSENSQENLIKNETTSNHNCSLGAGGVRAP